MTKQATKSTTKPQAKSIEPLLRFLNDSPTPFHAVTNVVARLRAAGYVAVDEGARWEQALPGKYYFTRNDSSLVAVNLNRRPDEHGFRLVGAHTDSPCLKIKPNAITHNNGYAKLAVEVYGGALLNPWFDRDLGLAGRVTLKTAAGKLENRLLTINRPIAFIPSLAIHLNRDVNDNRSINKQKELPAVLCRVPSKPSPKTSPKTSTKTSSKTSPTAPDFDRFLRTELKRQHRRLSLDKILAFELCLYDCQQAEIVGLENEFIASARLDNLLSCYAGMEALLTANSTAKNAGGNDNAANTVLVLNDHEEVGSVSTSGAEGPFLQSILQRLCGDQATLARALSRSLLISADNAHGVHPNYAHKHEPDHQPLLNDGPVIKVNNNQRYATNSETAALFRQICEQGGLPCQTIVVRSDMACGSTIGPITAARLGVRTVDIGVPQLGMHSIRELAGVKDQHTLLAALKGFYEMSEWPF